MNMYEARQYIELFNLLFLDFLGRKLDKRRYVLKGGCNLRFFMKSFRYSEDMDIDVQDIPKQKLSDTVDLILNSRSFAQVLQINEMGLERYSAPKQTETTQRWKMLLKVRGVDVLLNTKTEFSRRGVSQEHVFEAIDPLLVGAYSLAPILTNHYTPHAAYKQKVEALITRSATQARDVFDLYLLLSTGVDSQLDDFKLNDCLGEAASNAMSVTFDIFKAQVFSYLHPDYQSNYDSQDLWDDMVLKVAEAIEEAAQ